MSRLTVLALFPFLVYAAIYVLPVFVLRPNVLFPPPSEALAERVRWAVNDMDGGVGNFNGSGARGPAPTLVNLTDDDLREFQQNGFLIVRQVIPTKHMDAIEGMFTHVQVHPNLIQKTRDYSSCASAVFGFDRLIQPFAELIHRLNMHWVAADILQTSKLVLVNSILHYNTRDCSKEGSILSTHQDFFTLPSTMERREGEDGYFGDNGLIAWIAVDELSPQSVTMQIAKGSHLRYTKAYPDDSVYHQDKFCPLFWEDMAKEGDRDPGFLSSFVELPVLHPGDAVFFSGMTYHRPMPYCAQGCNRTNSRRITLRYVDGERTKFRSDVPSQANHFSARQCPSFLGRWFLGEKCKYTPGMPVEEADFPIVVNKDGPRRIATDGARKEYFELETIGYFLGCGRRVHHDTCGLEGEYKRKIFQRLAYNLLPPFLYSQVWKAPPALRPGEEKFVKKIS